jgi:hypothetical protein
MKMLGAHAYKGWRLCTVVLHWQRSRSTSYGNQLQCKPTAASVNSGHRGCHTPDRLHGRCMLDRCMDARPNGVRGLVNDLSPLLMTSRCIFSRYPAFVWPGPHPAIPPSRRRPRPRAPILAWPRTPSRPIPSQSSRHPASAPHPPRRPAILPSRCGPAPQAISAIPAVPAPSCAQAPHLANP